MFRFCMDWSVRIEAEMAALQLFSCNQSPLERHLHARDGGRWQAIPKAAAGGEVCHFTLYSIS